MFAGLTTSNRPTFINKTDHIIILIEIRVASIYFSLPFAGILSGDQPYLVNRSPYRRGQ
jgi:hypothetical protein